MSQIKNIPQLMIDAAIILLAYTLAFYLRFDFRIPPAYTETFWKGFLIAAAVKPLVFVAMGFHRKLWRYASLRDAVSIFIVVTVASACSWCILPFFYYADYLPGSIIIMDWLILLFLSASSRMACRMFRDHRLTPRVMGGRRTLIMGAGDAGRILLTEIGREQVPEHDIVGFVDDDDEKRNMFLDGIPVLGGQEDLRDLVSRHRIEELIIAVPSARGTVLRRMIENCNRTGARVRILPSICDIIDSKVTTGLIRDVKPEDLLGREAVVLDKSGIIEYLQGKTVLVSGAAGSIGSEICRQITSFSPETLILLDNAETPLFYTERELSAKHPELRIIPILGDVRDKARIEAIFAEFKPDVVFHAAAYKHVSMVENNPTEAVSNNIRGTKFLADVARVSGVDSFVMISSDKAVNPTNIMGASKRVAEIYIQSLANTCRTKFSTVRFGNVLGSNGSVIPIFMEQIRNGGPVTVTDPNVIRYFMTIPEAAQLVLQAGGLGRGGEIFILDMGEPIRILDLAEELIRLSGLVPRKDIEIAITGLRPGEKLYEELLTRGEGILETGHEKIRIAAPIEVEPDLVSVDIERLIRLAERRDVDGIVHALRRMLLEYTPSSRFRPDPEKENLRKHRERDLTSTARVIPFRRPAPKQDMVADGI